ncbi:MAG: hypothetical protein IJN02_00105 [Bacteroidales bacterium]|nr:hypothetical protein [Bacteroidales bacterium]
MSFKKTVTFTANVSDYTDGTVSARVQAENKILGDLVAFILSQNLGISVQEKVSIGDAKWSGEPFYCSTSGYTGDVNNNNSLCTDIYFLGKGIDKKCLGLSIDTHTLYCALSDTPTNDMRYGAANLGSYGRVPTAQLRKLQSSKETNRDKYLGNVKLYQFDQSANTLSISINYWKSQDTIVLITGLAALVIDRNSCMYTNNGSYGSLHFGLNDDFLISDASYSYSARNENVSSNYQLNYAMSFNPFFIKYESNYSIWERPNSPLYVPTSILCHKMSLCQQIDSTDIPLNISGGIEATALLPMVTAHGFPRIGNNELYIKKMYVPMTYPAITSPVKIGYTPGKLNAENVYSLNGKNYVCLNNGVIGLFVEVEDQGD